MPKVLLDFLKSISKEDCDAIYEWLDGDPKAVDIILDKLIALHYD